MGCSPSTLVSSTSPDTAEVTATAVESGGCGGTAAGAGAGAGVGVGGEKDGGSLFFCIKLRRSRQLRRCSQQNGGDGSGGSGGTGSAVNGDDLLGHGNLCNQALLNPAQTKNEADYERMTGGKKDSIVTVAALGNFTHTVVRRATGTASRNATSEGSRERPSQSSQSNSTYLQKAQATTTSTTPSAKTSLTQKCSSLAEDQQPQQQQQQELTAYAVCMRPPCMADRMASRIRATGYSDSLLRAGGVVRLPTDRAARALQAAQMHQQRRTHSGEQSADLHPSISNLPPHLPFVDSTTYRPSSPLIPARVPVPVATQGRPNPRFDEYYGTSGASGTTTSSGAKPEKRKSSIVLTPEDESMERNLTDMKFPTVLPPNPQLKALLIFHKTDNICEVVTEACHRQQLDVTVARTKEGALETLSNTNGNADFYHLIIIDARSTKYLDAEYIARSIRHTNGHHFTTIIAVVKKSFFEKDDVLIALLDAGVNRCVPETTNLSMCSIELKQILHSIVRPHNVMSTQQALYTALHRLKEVLIITDNLLRIQYANKAAERLLNMRLDEIISKPLGDIFLSDVSSINTQGKKNREFDEILTVRRKSQEGIPMHVRVIPVACIGRNPTHYVFNFDVPGAHGDFVATLPQQKEAPRGSLHSIRRGSVDVRSVASDGLRRTSLAKLTSLPLEAPITKIINLLSQVQENCSPEEARLIDKVLEFLKREGLYSPQMKEIRTDDPIATDLIGALLTGPTLYSSRRSSNDSIIRIGNRPSTIMPAKMKATPHIMELLEESLNWEFDIFKLEDITDKHPLLYLGMEIFRRFDVFATLNVDESVCKSWLAVMEAHYHSNNSYHNSTHAADVMQATGAFIIQLAAKDMAMDRIDEATALIAAVAHDVDHPGRSSAFLCNSNSQLAIMYNDLTVLESHHAATTFKLTLADDKINIFKNLDKETYKSARSVIIDMVLATEMTRHFEHLAKFVSVFGTDEEPRDIVQTDDDSSILIRRMLIKVADVSNPARPSAYCVEWARRIAEEYFMQTDEEKAKALPIVMPMFDRATCSIPKSQIGFIEYIIQDMMHAWDSFIDMPELITYMQINYSQWKKFEEQGIHTLADIKGKQASLNCKKNAK